MQACLAHSSPRRAVSLALPHRIMEVYSPTSSDRATSSRGRFGRASFRRPLINGLGRYTADDVQLPKAPPPTAITATHSDPSDDRRLSTSTDRTVISSRPPSPISGASSINEDAGYRRGMFRRPNLSMESLRSVTSGRWSGNRTPSIMSNASDREDHSSAYQRKNRAKRRKRKKDEVFVSYSISVSSIFVDLVFTRSRNMSHKSYRGKSFS